MSFNISQTKVSFDTPSSIVYERKFDTAIRDSFITPLLKRYHEDALSYDDKVLLSSSYCEVRLEKMSQSTEHYPIFLLALLNDQTGLSKYHASTKTTGKIHELCLKSIQIQLDYILENNYTHTYHSIKKLFSSRLQSKNTPEILSKLLYAASWFKDVINQSNKLYGIRKTNNNTWNDVVKDRSKVSFAKDKNLGITLVWNQHYLYMKMSESHYIAPRSVLLMYHNKICDLLSVLVLAWVSEGNVNPEGSFEHTVVFVKELCSLHVKYQVKFFDIAKVLEGLGIGETLIEVEEWDNPEFLRCVTNDLYDATGFDYVGSHLQYLIKSCDTAMRHELICLSKITGHPYVNMRQGAYDLFNKVNEVYDVNYLTIIKCVNHCKENYIRNHILKEGKWPPCHLVSHDCPKPMLMAYVNQKDPNDPSITKRYGKVHIEDYVYVELDQNRRYNTLENAIPTLKDKTISLTRSKVLKHYFTSMDSKVGPKPSWKDTRLLLAYLLHPTAVHDHQKYLAEFTQSDSLDELLDYLVIRIVPKEKELKVSFRGYGCKTMEDRHRTLAQEKEAMRFLGDFSDEQAMTLGELDLLRRLDAFRRLKLAYTNHYIMYIVIDASAWNSHFRKETVDFVMDHTLSRVHNNSTFSKTHMAYEKSLVYIPDHNMIYYWYGQGGGVEGQNQDTWVEVYIGQIKVALEGLDIKYHILCKGDDLRVALAIPKHMYKSQELSDLKNKIVKKLSHTLKDFGHKIKIEESYGSCKYFAFSKSSSIGKVEMPQTFRKIQKCYGATNAFMATLDEYIGSTFSNAHSACKTSPVVIPSYYVGLFWMFVYLLDYNTFKGLSDDELVAQTVIPSMVGGFPIIYLHNMHVRAESDLLSPYIGLYKFCEKYYPDVARVMSNFMVLSDSAPTSYIGLYRDPYSLPIDRPQLPSAYLRGQVLPMLRKMVKNEDVKELFDVIEEGSDSMVVRALDSCNVLHVKILSNLYGGSPEGIQDELVRKFESARSINELLILRIGKKRTMKILRNTVRKETFLQRWRYLRIRKPELSMGRSFQHLMGGQCPAQMAHMIRGYAWGKPVEGITMPPLQHQIGLYPAYHETPWVLQNHFSYYISETEDSVVNYDRLHYSVGSNRPFLGYTTRTGTIEPSVHFIEKDAILTKLQNLLDLASWTHVASMDKEGNMIESNCRELIRKLIGLYTATDLKELAPFTATRRSGTIQHHVRSPSFRESIVPNTLSNIYSYVRGESDCHVTLRSSPQHYKINFLHVMCYVTWLLHLELEMSNDITSSSVTWGVTTPCSYCSTPIIESPLVFDNSYINQINFTPLALTRVNSIAENIIRESILEFKTKSYRDSEDVTELGIETAERGVLQEIMYSLYYNKQALQRRYTEHTVNSEGLNVLNQLTPHSSSRDVGLTELKRLNVENIVEYLIEVVNGLLLGVFSHRSDTALTSHLLSIPASDLPWYGLLCFFHKTGQLPKIINNLCSRSGARAPPCHYTPMAASVYLAIAVQALLRDTIGITSFVILSYYTVGHISCHMETLCRKNLTAFFNRKYSRMIKKSVLHNEKEREALVSLCKDSLIIIYAFACIPDYVMQVTNQLLDVPKDDFPIMSLEEIPYMRYTEINDDSSLCPIRILEQYCMRCGIKIPDLFVEDEEEYDNRVRRIEVMLQRDRMEIKYTTLSLCIQKVRSNQKFHEAYEEDIQEDQAPNVERSLADIVMGRADEVGRGYFKLAGIEYNHPIEEHPILIQDWPIGQKHITMNAVGKFLGPANGSSTFLYQALVSLGLNEVLESSNCYACLADGIGEGSLLLATLGNGFNKLVFHSLNEGGEIGRVPVYLLEAYQRKEPDILVDHLNEGMDDLTRCALFKRLEKYNLVYNIITLDIEVKDEKIIDSGMIYQNTAIFIQRNLSPVGVAILRVNIRHVDYLQSGLMYLMGATHNIIVLQPDGFKLTPTVYLVVVGIRPGIKLEYESPKRPWSDVTGWRLRTNLIRILNHNRNLLMNEDPVSLSLLDIDYRHMYTVRLCDYPLLYESKICQFFDHTYGQQEGSSFSHQSRSIFNNHWEKHYLTHFGWIEKFITNLRQKLRADYKKMETESRGVEQTRAHRDILLHRMSLSMGYLFMLEKYQGPRYPITITALHVEEGYEQFIYSLPECDRYGYGYVDHKSRNCTHGGIKCKMFDRFVDGVDLFLLWWSTMTYLVPMNQRVESI